MQQLFTRDLLTTFPTHSFTPISLKATPLYIYEVKDLNELGHSIKFTVMTDIEPDERSFKVHNVIVENPITHICIDGDFIPFGQEKYDLKSDKFKDGRPDCLIFEQERLLLVELKLDQESETEKSKWNNFFKGVTQIEDFVTFLRNNHFEVTAYFPRVSAVICMRFEPVFRSNTARNTEKYKRSIQLGIELIASNFVEFTR
ncbi:MAG: hypothetical protein ACOVOW_12355 [Spirosomataceae bacterium]